MSAPLTTHTDAASRLPIQSGADGVVSGTRSADEPHLAIRAVSAGGMYVGSGLAANLQGRLGDIPIRPTVDRPGPTRAPREVETLRFIADGLAYAQVARQMCVSPGTP